MEIATNKVTQEISLDDAGGIFYDIAVMPVKKKAYVTNVRSQDLYVVDLALGAVVKRVNVGWWPQMVVVTPDGRSAYVRRHNNPYDAGGLVVVDTETDQVVATVSLPNETEAAGGNGRFDLLATSPDGPMFTGGLVHSGSALSKHPLTRR